jgi:hypothetical protein
MLHSRPTTLDRDVGPIYGSATAWPASTFGPLLLHICASDGSYAKAST